MSITAIVVQYIERELENHNVLTNMLQLRDMISFRGSLFQLTRMGVLTTRNIYDLPLGTNIIFKPVTPHHEQAFGTMLQLLCTASMHEHFRRVGFAIAKLLRTSSTFEYSSLADNSMAYTDAIQSLMKTVQHTRKDDDTAEWELQVLVQNAEHKQENIALFTHPNADQRSMLQKADTLLADIMRLLEQHSRSREMYSQDRDQKDRYEQYMRLLFDVSKDAVVSFDESQAYADILTNIISYPITTEKLDARNAFIRDALQFYDKQAKRILSLSSAVEEQAHSLIALTQRNATSEVAHDQMADDYETKIESLKDVCELIVVPSEDAYFASTRDQIRDDMSGALHYLIFQILFSSHEDAACRWASSILSRTIRSLLHSKERFLHEISSQFEKEIYIESDISSFSFTCSVHLAKAIYEFMQSNHDIILDHLYTLCRLSQNSSDILDIWYNKDSTSIDYVQHENYNESIFTRLSELSRDILLGVDVNKLSSVIISSSNIQNVNHDLLMKACDVALEHALFLISDHLIREEFVVSQPSAPVLLSHVIQLTYPSEKAQEMVTGDLCKLLANIDLVECASTLRLLFDVNSLGGSRRAYLEQVFCVMENYPVHLLCAQSERLPYLHPLMNKEALKELFGDHVIHEQAKRADKTLQATTGVLFGKIIRTVANHTRNNALNKFNLAFSLQRQWTDQDL
jgi:hypothetical protein